MKVEPLKNKKTTFKECGCNNEDGCVCLGEEAFEVEDVKSAVLWLQYKVINKGYDTCENDWLRGYNNAILAVMKLIKEAFEDVVQKDDERPTESSEGSCVVTK